MSINTTEGIESCPHDQRSTVTEAIASFVESTAEALSESKAPESAVNRVRESGDELAQLVGETVERQSERIEELEEEQDEHQERTARERAADRQRLTNVEERLDDVKADSADETPTPNAEETTQRTPIERLSDGNREDVATNVTPSVERALTLFENLPDWGTSTPKGITLRPADSPKKLLEAATDESLAWTQYYRAVEVLERLSKGAVTFFDHQRHGKMLVLHEDSQLHSRLTNEESTHSHSLLARGD